MDSARGGGGHLARADDAGRPWNRPPASLLHARGDAPSQWDLCGSLDLAPAADGPNNATFRVSSGGGRFADHVDRNLHAAGIAREYALVRAPGEARRLPGPPARIPSGPPAPRPPVPRFFRWLDPGWLVPAGSLLVGRSSSPFPSGQGLEASRSRGPWTPELLERCTRGQRRMFTGLHPGAGSGKLFAGALHS